MKRISLGSACTCVERDEQIMNIYVCFNFFEDSLAQIACPELLRGVVMLKLYEGADFDSPGTQHHIKISCLHKNGIRILA